MNSGGNKPLRHDLGRRRTLKSRYVLLRQYGVYVVTACFLGMVGFTINKKFFNPPEFESKEEKKKSE